MDFIERIFHISPDGGSGAVEALILAFAGFAVLAARRCDAPYGGASGDRLDLSWPGDRAPRWRAWRRRVRGLPG